MRTRLSARSRVSADAGLRAKRGSCGRRRSWKCASWERKHGSFAGGPMCPRRWSGSRGNCWVTPPKPRPPPTSRFQNPTSSTPTPGPGRGNSAQRSANKVRRLVSPPDVHGGLVLALAGAGILVNLAAAALLAGPSRNSLNIRGAFLHVTTDLAAFVGTAVAGALILATGWNRFDPLASLAVAGLIFWSSAILLRESSRILLEISPGEMPPEEVAEAMLAIPDVVEVHDLHVWTVGSGFPALSAHVLVRPEGDCHEARRELAAMLAERFGLEHTTLQVEHARQQRPLGTELPLARG